MARTFRTGGMHWRKQMFEDAIMGPRKGTSRVFANTADGRYSNTNVARELKRSHRSERKNVNNLLAVEAEPMTTKVRRWSFMAPTVHPIEET